MSQSKPQGRSYWVEHIEAWRASGVSRSEYCQAHGLSRKTFGWWSWRLDQERREPSAPEASCFLPVELSEAALAGPGGAGPGDQRMDIALSGGGGGRPGVRCRGAAPGPDGPRAMIAVPAGGFWCGRARSISEKAWMASAQHLVRNPGMVPNETICGVRRFHRVVFQRCVRCPPILHESFKKLE